MDEQTTIKVSSIPTSENPVHRGELLQQWRNLLEVAKCANSLDWAEFPHFGIKGLGGAQYLRHVFLTDPCLHLRPEDLHLLEKTSFLAAVSVLNTRLSKHIHTKFVARCLIQSSSTILRHYPVPHSRSRPGKPPTPFQPEQRLHALHASLKRCNSEKGDEIPLVAWIG